MNTCGMERKQHNKHEYGFLKNRPNFKGKSNILSLVLHTKTLRHKVPTFELTAQIKD